MNEAQRKAMFAKEKARHIGSRVFDKIFPVDKEYKLKQFDTMQKEKQQKKAEELKNKHNERILESMDKEPEPNYAELTPDDRIKLNNRLMDQLKIEPNASDFSQKTQQLIASLPPVERDFFIQNAMAHGLGKQTVRHGKVELDDKDKQKEFQNR